MGIRSVNLTTGSQDKCYFGSRRAGGKGMPKLTRGRFSKVPEAFRARKAIKNLKPYDYRAVSFTYILNVNRGSLHTRSFRRTHFSVLDADELNCNGFTGSKRFRGVGETGTWKRSVDQELGKPRSDWQKICSLAAKIALNGVFSWMPCASHRSQGSKDILN